MTELENSLARLSQRQGERIKELDTDLHLLMEAAELGLNAIEARSSAGESRLQEVADKLRRTITVLQKKNAKVEELKQG